MSSYFFDCRAKQSFPVFWIFGGLGGLGFALLGGCFTYTYINSNAHERDGGMLGVGIFFLIMGLLLLAGVIYTLIKAAGSNDLSFKVDMVQTRGNKKYDAGELVNYIEIGRNNVILFDTVDGQMRVFGTKGKLIVEISIATRDGANTYHVTNPSATDETSVILENIFSERFPVQGNWILNKEQAIKAIEMLYASRSLKEFVMAQGDRVKNGRL